MRSSIDSSPVLRTPVLIVGGGPVGLSLAGDLGWRGNACMLVEKGSGEVTQPKMDLVGVRSMEFCRRWGLVDEVEAAPYPRDTPQDYVFLTALNGFELGREKVPCKDLEPRPIQSPQKRERCPQHMFDPVLRRFASSFPRVDLRHYTMLESLREEESHVVATVRDLRTDAVSTVHADHLVGADGGDSTVRKLLGTGMTGRGTLTYSTNVMVRIPNFDALHDKGRGYRYMFVGPEGTWLVFTSANGRDEWRVLFVGDKVPQKLTPEEIRAALFRAMGREFDYEVLSVMPWVRRELVADSYATRRCFLVGDAAHLMSPTGGFGMNTGIQDAVDLSWKLDAVMRGWGGKALLASYDEERRPVAIRNVAQATSNLARMLENRDRRPPAEAFEAGPLGDAARRSYGEWFTRLLRTEWLSIGINLGYRYDQSRVICYDDAARPELQVSTYEQTTLPGARAPHAWLADGHSTLDAFGKGFVLVQLGADAPSAYGIRAEAARRDVPLSVLEITNPEICALYERKLVLVRPDGHVGWRGDTDPDDAKAVLDVLTGAVASD